MASWRENCHFPFSSTTALPPSFKRFQLSLIILTAQDLPWLCQETNTQLSVLKVKETDTYQAPSMTVSQTPCTFSPHLSLQRVWNRCVLQYFIRKQRSINQSIKSPKKRLSGKTPGWFQSQKPVIAESFVVLKIDVKLKMVKSHKLH